MSEEVKMMDIKNQAMDRYQYDKDILAELNCENIEEAKRIIKADMKIIEDEYEEEFTVFSDEKESSSTTANDN